MLEGCTEEMRKGKNKKLKWEEERKILSERRYDHRRQREEREKDIVHKAEKQIKAGRDCKGKNDMKVSEVPDITKSTER